VKKGRFVNRLFTVLVFVFLYAPIFVLIVFSFNASKSRTVWAGFTFNWYRELFSDTLILNSFYTTILVAVLASVTATVLGTAAAVGLFNMKKLPKTILLSVNNIPVTNPDIITGVSLMLLFVFFGTYLIPSSWVSVRCCFRTLPSISPMWFCPSLPSFVS
jgi:spermidine/putrescine transport system permease protein